MTPPRLVGEWGRDLGRPLQLSNPTSWVHHEGRGFRVAVSGDVSVARGQGLFVAVVGILTVESDHQREGQEQPQASAAGMLDAVHAGRHDVWGSLVGEFAALVIDEAREEASLIADPFATLPLLYAARDGRLVFANDGRVLASSQGWSLTPDHEVLALYLADLPADPTRSFYAGIRRVAAGTRVVANRSAAIAQREYWRPASRSPRPGWKREDYVAAYRAALDAAVRLRTGTRPVAVSFSGGVDSSSVYWVAREIGASPVPIAVRYPGDVADEAEHIGVALEGGRAEDVTFRPPGLERIGEILSATGDPWDPLLPYIGWIVGERAQRLGCRTVLTGSLGDVVGGHNRVLGSQLARSWRWRAFRHHFASAAESPLRTFARMIAQQPLVAVARRGVRSAPSARQNAYLQIARREVVQEYQLRARRVEVWARRLRVHPTAGEDVAFVLSQSTVHDELAGATRMHTHFGLKSGHPFADRRLVDLVLSAPGELHWQQGVSRQLLRNALRGTLPEQVRARTSKGSFSGHFAKRMAAILNVATPIRLQVCEALGDQVSPRALEKALKRAEGGCSAGEAWSLAKMVVAGIWVIEGLR